MSPKINEMTKSTINMTNNTFAIPAEATAIPENPSAAAIIATIKKITAHVNIMTPLKTVTLI